MDALLDEEKDKGLGMERREKLHRQKSLQEKGVRFYLMFGQSHKNLFLFVCSPRIGAIRTFNMWGREGVSQLLTLAYRGVGGGQEWTKNGLRNT